MLIRACRRRAAVFVTGGHHRFRRLDRNRRARLVFLAEKLEARTKEPGQHGGVLKRTGLAVLRALLFHFLCAATGRLDPSYDALARAAAVARSSVALALQRLEAAGILERTPRLRWVRAGGRKRCVQASNAYRLNVPLAFRAAEGDWAAPSSESENRTVTTPPKTNQPCRERGAAGAGGASTPPGTASAAAPATLTPELQRALARLGHAVADRRGAGAEGAGDRGRQLALGL